MAFLDEDGIWACYFAMHMVVVVGSQSVGIVQDCKMIWKRSIQVQELK